MSNEETPLEKAERLSGSGTPRDYRWWWHQANSIAAVEQAKALIRIADALERIAGVRGG